MRGFAIGILCLVGGVAWAVSLSYAPSAKPAVSQAARPAIATPAAKAVKTPAPAAQPPAQADMTPANEPAQAIVKQKPAPVAAPADAQVAAPASAKPAEPPVVPALAQPAAKPAEPPTVQAATQPDVKTIEPPAAVHPVEAQPAAPPAQPPVQGAAKPPETQPVQPAALPAEPAPAAPAAKTEAAAVPACPGHPDAIGTSRVLTISPTQYTLLGVMQYKQTLPLKDHEVVLTFDDGPIPPYTNSILDTLKANCVEATYFLVGEMAHARPYLVRRIYNEGHSIGTHTQHHPFAMQRLSMQRVEREVDGGIDSVDYALGDPKALSPFFRIPGLGRTNAIEHFLESKGLVTWSADIDTDDWWRGTTPGALIQRTMRRLNARGRGILLMHDIHPATALALPALLKELKAQGYHVVHVVAAGEHPNSLPEVVASPLEKENWPRVLHANAEKTGGAMSALRHKVKITLARRHQRHRVAKRDVADKVDYAVTGSVTRSLTRTY
jgi:peptidoglycan/xylan/chitin deacetylase (PgdA/CDA1 family)